MRAMTQAEVARVLNQLNFIEQTIADVGAVVVRYADRLGDGEDGLAVVQLANKAGRKVDSVRQVIRALGKS